MANNFSNKLSVREGLIRVVTAERFQSKPQPGGNIQVVVMQKIGNTLRHYVTLRSPRDKLSLGEKVWGDFICYIVDLSLRKMHIEQDFLTRDHITNVHVEADISYQVVDGELVAIGVEDALQALRDEIVMLLKREIGRLSLEHVTEQYLEGLLQKNSASFLGWLGIRVLKVRISTEWDKAVLDDLRARRDDLRRHEREDGERRRKEQIEAEDLQRKRRLEKEDIEHVNEILHQLGLHSLPADARLKLLSMPRAQAFDKIGEFIQQQRALVQDVLRQRAKEEYDLLRQMIDRGILEDFDLQDFGKTLLDRYTHMLSAHELLGVPPSLLFGDSPRGMLGEGKKPKPPSKKNKTVEDVNENADEESDDTERD